MVNHHFAPPFGIICFYFFPGIEQANPSLVCIRETSGGKNVGNICAETRWLWFFAVGDEILPSNIRVSFNKPMIRILSLTNQDLMKCHKPREVFVLTLPSKWEAWWWHRHMALIFKQLVDRNCRQQKTGVFWLPKTVGNASKRMRWEIWWIGLTKNDRVSRNSWETFPKLRFFDQLFFWFSAINGITLTPRNFQKFTALLKDGAVDSFFDPVFCRLPQHCLEFPRGWIFWICKEQLSPTLRKASFHSFHAINGRICPWIWCLA